MKTSTQPYQRRGRKRFVQASSLVEKQIRKVGESRGFAVSRLLTHWDEIVGPDMAAIARPVDVKYGRGDMGATLTVLTTGAQAPMLEMQKEKLRARVNACYGYAAVGAIRLTQTASTGFAEGAARFGPAPKVTKPGPSPEIQTEARNRTARIGDPDLRAALERLGTHVLGKPR